MRIDCYGTSERASELHARFRDTSIESKFPFGGRATASAPKSRLSRKYPRFRGLIVDGEIGNYREYVASTAHENFTELGELGTRYACSTARYLENLSRDKSGPSITRYKKAGATP